MKKTIIITSLEKGVALLTICNNGSKSKPRRFASIDNALEFAVSAGNRQCQLYLNGYKTVPYGWVA